MSDEIEILKDRAERAEQAALVSKRQVERAEEKVRDAERRVEEAERVKDAAVAAVGLEEGWHVVQAGYDFTRNVLVRRRGDLTEAIDLSDLGRFSTLQTFLDHVFEGRVKLPEDVFVHMNR